MKEFNVAINKPEPAPVTTGEEIPKTLDIFQRTESQFLPDGKSVTDLTEDEAAQVKRQYRFDPYKPGIYQTITGFGNMIN